MLHCFPNGEYRPIAYLSRSLNSAKKNYSQIEKEGLAIIFWHDQVLHVPVWAKVHLRTGHKPLLKMTLPHSFWQQHAFSIGPYSSHHTSVKLNSSLLLKWPPPMLCPDYHRNTGRMPASRPNLPGVNGARKQTYFSVLETARQTVQNPVLAMTQNVWPTHFCTTPALK